ncbi:hypothetical protein HMPREF9144_1554 [Prevotella pallens ATCC 700821]|uniref:Uncharacterized protein n=1 Tax=Prevotella pallens ATCC 700821 TaxID=997353 RepID=F9DIR4_9BACT|nr:hypothetical protein HMPREF9144_1554 [Prevotella pallens ATCC 700821]
MASAKSNSFLIYKKFINKIILQIFCKPCGLFVYRHVLKCL